MRFIFISIIFIAVFFSCVFVWFNQPHITVEQIRINNSPETIRAMWVAWACGGSERITEIIEPDSHVRDGPLSIRVPSGGLNPELSEAAYSNNVFVLTGYRYKTRRTNIITGHVSESESSRFDVVNWHVELPYKKLNAQNKMLTVNTPLSWKSHSDSVAKNKFKGVKGGSC